MQARDLKHCRSIVIDFAEQVCALFPSWHIESSLVSPCKAAATMNYDGAEGLEFGGGNVKVDPSVAAGTFP